MIRAEVADATESLLTPSRYLLKQVEVFAGSPSHSPRELVSFRGRFAEQAFPGERIIARGRLEAVRSKNAEHFRLVVGEEPKDVFRSIW